MSTRKRFMALNLALLLFLCLLPIQALAADIIAGKPESFNVTESELEGPKYTFTADSTGFYLIKATPPNGVDCWVHQVEYYCSEGELYTSTYYKSNIYVALYEIENKDGSETLHHQCYSEGDEHFLYLEQGQKCAFSVIITNSDDAGQYTLSVSKVKTAELTSSTVTYTGEPVVYSYTPKESGGITVTCKGGTSENTPVIGNVYTGFWLNSSYDHRYDSCSAYCSAGKTCYFVVHKKQDVTFIPVQQKLDLDDIKGEPVTAYTDISFRYSVSETTTPGRWELPYSDEMLNRNAKEFHNDLAKISLGVAMASTNIAVDGVNVGAEYIQEMLQKMGYVHRTPSENYGDTQIETDSCQYIFAVKKLKGTDDYVVCTVIRSNGYGAEWVSNAHVANGNNINYSAGFKGAADGVYTELLNYIDSLPVEKSHIRLWVTGFSRGGAIANLLGARLNEESGISANKIFVYGFAVPRTVQKSAAKNYNNIYNIVNQCDLVPRVPLKAWGYERYGVDKFLPCASKDSLRYRSVRSEMEKYFDSMMSASGLNKTHYSLVSSQERTLDLLLAYLCDIFPTVQSYRDDGYQDAVMNACRMWQLKDSDIPPERLLKDVFGVPEYCGQAIFQLFENWKKLTPPERTAAIIAAEATLNQWASQNGSVQAQKVRNMVLDLLGHVALYVTLDSIPTAASVFSMSKSKQYIELVSLIANVIDRAKEGRAFASALLMQHWPETYLSWMMAGDESKIYSKNSYKILSVKCPVDITVYDEGGNIVASIENDTIDENINGLYCETDCFGEKMILIPDDAAYRTVITAREEGTVDIVERKYSAEDEPIDTTCFIQLPMEERQVFNVAIDDDCTVTTNGKTLAPSVVMQENNATVSIHATAQTGGTVVGAKDYLLGDTAELIAMPDEQYSFTGWYEGSKLLSSEEVLHFSAVTDRNLTAKFEKEQVTPPSPPVPFNPFTDVKSDAYYYEPVLWAVNHEPQITNGTSETTFSPKDECLRCQIVTFLWRAMGCPEPTSTVNPFMDVKPSDYFYKAVLWAVEQEITNGMDATHFGPNLTCTRGQAVTFLWRAEGKPAPKTQVSEFTDVQNPNVYFYTPVLWAVENGITNGTGDNKFSPEMFCLREQIVTFLYRDLK